MLRHCVSLIVALYAIGFAVLALASVRWPSLLTLGVLFGEQASALGQIEGLLNWRELGLTHGLAYLLTALCFYFSVTLIGRGKRSAIVFYLIAVGTGFLPLMLLDFEPGWWQTPTQFQQIIMLSAIIAVFLTSLIWELGGSRADKTQQKNAVSGEGQIVLDQAIIPVNTVKPAPAKMVKKPVRRQPVPPAIARQRASFAAHGRRAKARHMR